MFTKDNLALSHGKAKPIQGAGEEKSTVAWREEYDEISDKSVDIARTAWRNWVEMNTFVHPGLMDCVAAHKCVVEAQNLSVKTLIEYFTKHIGEQNSQHDLNKTSPAPPSFYRKQSCLCRRGRNEPVGLQQRVPSPLPSHQHTGLQRRHTTANQQPKIQHRPKPRRKHWEN